MFSIPGICQSFKCAIRTYVSSVFIDQFKLVEKQGSSIQILINKYRTGYNLQITTHRNVKLKFENTIKIFSTEKYQKGISTFSEVIWSGNFFSKTIQPPEITPTKCLHCTKVLICIAYEEIFIGRPSTEVFHKPKGDKNQ